MAKKKSRTNRSAGRGRLRRSGKQAAAAHKEAPAASQKLSPKRQKKGSSKPAVLDAPERSPSKPFPVVGIGASAGGLEAFTTFLKALPVDTGMAFVLVQHMDPTHESLLNQLLAKQTAMPVLRAEDAMRVEPDHVYVIPANMDLTIHEGKLRLVPRDAGALLHTPIDTFLRALAEDQHRSAIGVILSGIGSDGTKGLQSIKAEGGVTFAQDAASAKYSGMPRNAEASGCVDLVLSPEEIARELARMRHHPYLRVSQPQVEPELPAEKNGNVLKVFRLVRSATGVDFTHYRQITIRRRISRRMLVQQCETLAQYVKYLDTHPDEVRELFQDVLIHVTEFFREPKVLQRVQKLIFPRIAASHVPGEPIRIWVPGCSTGEEVYSVAIALSEYLGQEAASTAIQIFGTDISETNVQKSRAAIYPQASMAKLSPERLKRFFIKMENGYQVVKPIRELCVFAQHNLTKDPPFSRMDLISCRNVLIYLEPSLQRRVLEFLHYTLKPTGFLILGKSEGVSAAANLFELEDRKANIYSKQQTRARPLPEFRMLERKKAAAVVPPAPPPAPLSELRKTVERIILDRYAPAGLIVDSHLHIIHFQGDISPFLMPASGEPSFDLLKIVRTELILEIRAAVNEARKSGTPARREDVSFKRNGKVYQMDIEVMPLEGQMAKGTVYLVLFQNQRSSIPEKTTVKSARTAAMKREVEETERLRKQATVLQEQLRSLMEDHEAATEELRAANEEVLASNEELQSTNEELQSAKEELQSSNEELSTLNDELQNRNTELSETANDLNTLLNAVEIPILILDNDRCIRRFTSKGEKLLNLMPSDVGRPISQIRTNIEIPDLDEMASEVLERGVPVEREVRDQHGHWYALRMKVYQETQGILIVLVDIHDIKQYSTAIVETMRECLVVLDSSFRVLLASTGFYKTFQVDQKDTENKLLWELGNGQWNILKLRELLERVLPEQKEVVGYEVEHDFPAIGHKTMVLNARQLFQTDGVTPKMLLMIEDITERREWEKRLQTSESRARALLESASQAILAHGPDGRMVMVNATTKQMFGYTDKELLGQPVEMLFPARFREIHRRHCAEYFARPQNRPMGAGFNLVGRRKNGSEFPIEVNLSYVESMDAPLAVAFVSDVTTRKAAERKTRQLSARLMTTTEDERKRIARELHDSFGSGLAILNMQFAELEQLLPPQPDFGENFETIRKQIADLAKASHDLSQQLHPSVLSQLGLKAALEAECKRFSKQTGLEVRFSAETVEGRLPDNIALCLYRVAQEGLENIRRHAQTKTVTLTLAKKGHEVVMELRDIGIGFDPTSARTRPGLGLVSMEERVRLVNGKLSVISKPGKGTKVEVRIPLED